MSDGIEIYFRDGLTSAQREMAEQSVVATVERKLSEISAARAQLAEENKLRDAVMAPLAELIQADQGAAEALKQLSARKTEPGVFANPEGSFGGEVHLAPVAPFDTVQQRTPPFDYSWSWQDRGGAGPFAQFGNFHDGRLGLDARAGPWMQGGADRFVHAHIGVGCFFKSDSPAVLELHAVRSSRYSFAMSASGLSAHATSDGGLEANFLRDNQPLMGGTSPLWHRRVSGPAETAADNTNFANGEYPDGMGGRFDAGEYAFSVGIYASADYSSGIGRAGVQSLVQSSILAMRMILR